MTVVEGILFAGVQLVLWSPLAVVGVPPVVMSVPRRWSLLGAGLWLTGVALAVAWIAALLVDMDRADATGQSGSILSGIGWLLAALAVATASIVLAARRRGVRA